jgi:hypothetical protein
MDTDEEGFSGRTISFFVTWVLAEYLFIVGLLRTIDLPTLGLLLFYTTFSTILLVLAVGLATLRRKLVLLRKFLTFDMAHILWPLVVGGFGTFIVLFVVFTAVGRTFNALPLDIILTQALIVVPSETVIFIILLPLLLPGKVFGIPGWLWAQLSFGGFHYAAFGIDLYQMFIAFTFGVIWYQIFVLGERVAFLGVGFVLAFHFVWNVAVLSTTGSLTVADPLVEIVNILS